MRDHTAPARSAADDSSREGTTVAANPPKEVELSRLILPESRPFADPEKLLDHGPFDWRKYEPIWVETDGYQYWLMNGVTRAENARRAGIAKLPARIFRRQ